MSYCFELTPDDVSNVINANGRWASVIEPLRQAMGVHNHPPLSQMALHMPPLDELSRAIFERLDLDDVVDAAIDTGGSLDRQTTAAYKEIERQLNELDTRILSGGYLAKHDDVDEETWLKNRIAELEDYARLRGEAPRA